MADGSLAARFTCMMTDAERIQLKDTCGPVHSVPDTSDNRDSQGDKKDECSGDFDCRVRRYW